MSRLISTTLNKSVCSSRLLCPDSRQFLNQATRVNSLYFSTSVKPFDAETKEEGSEASDSEVKETKAWTEKQEFLQEKKKEIAAKEGSSLGPAQYLGKHNTPFPMNPQFKHTAPLTNETKNKIFELYLKDPKKNTLRSLAVSYKISIRRAEAILKLKHLEVEMVKKGFVPLKKYQTGMEKILDAGNRSMIEELEPILPRVGKPLFRAVDEEVEFTPKDAAGEMKRTEFSELTEALLQDRVFEYRGLSGKEYNIDKESKPEALAVDSVHGTHKKFNFMFSDINPKLSLKERTVLVREKSGVLREASPLERQHYARRFDWPEQATLFKRDVSEAKVQARSSYSLHV